MSDKVRSVTLTKEASLLAGWGGGKRGLGPLTSPSGKVLVWLLLPKIVFKCQFLYVWKSFGKVRLSQLLCVDWLLAWNVTLSQVGLGLTEQASWYVLREAKCLSNLWLHGLWSRPRDYLVYNGGLSPFSSVWEDKHKSVTPFVHSLALGAWVGACHWPVQQGHDHRML